jgi:hypothetical protein
MAEPLGSVYADVQLRMDKLDQAIMQVSTKMDKLGKVMVDKADRPAASAQKTFLGLGKTITSAVPGVGLLMAGYQGLSRAIQGAVQFGNESIAAYQAQEVANARLGAVVRATGADAWTSHQQLMDMAKQQADATGHTYEEVQNMQSVLLGFTSITGETFNKASEGLINMAAVMGGDLASAANQFGKALDNPVESINTLTQYGFKFTDQQKEEIKALEEAGKHAEAQAIILESMKNAFGNAAVDINKAVFSQNNYNRVIADFKRESGEQFENAVTPIRNFFASIIEKAAESIKKTNETRQALENLRKSAAGEEVYEDNITGRIQNIKDQIMTLDNEKKGLEVALTISTGSAFEKQTIERIEKLKKEIEELRNEESDLMTARETADKIGAAATASLAGAQAKAYKITEEVKKRQDVLNQSVKAYEDELEVINKKEAKGIITAEEAEEQRAAAAEKHAGDIIALQQQYKEFLDIQNEINIVQQMIDDAGGDPEGKLTKELETLKAQKTAYEDYLKLIEREIGGQTELVRLNQQKAADTSLQEQTEEYIRQIQDLTASEYEACEIEKQRALLALQATTDYQRASGDEKRKLENELNLYYATQKRVEINKELKSMADEYRDATRDITREMENRKRIGESEIAWQERVIDNEKEWALEEFRKSEAFKSAMAEMKSGNLEYFSSIMKVIAAIEDRADAAKKAIEETSNVSFGQEMLSWAKDNITEIASAGAQVLNSLVEISTTLIQREIEEQNRLLEEHHKTESKILKERHEEKLEMLDEEMQAQLYAMGLVEAETVADYEAQLEAAKQTGDELAIYEASQALEKAQIEQEYADEKQRIEQEYADEKQRIDEELQKKQAELQYKAEMAAWHGQMIQAVINAAQAQLAVWTQTPFVLPVVIASAVLAAAVSAAQIGVISANKPVPRFETGGIVPGSSYSGDNMIIRANSGEAVLTQEMQKNMMDMLNSPARNGPTANVTLVVQLDATEIGRKTFALAGDGHYCLKARAVQ